MQLFLMDFKKTTPQAIGLTLAIIVPFFSTKNTAQADSNNSLPLQIAKLIPAIGALQVFPFENKKQDLFCTAFHIGQGIMLSAGHCFLGAKHCNGATVRFSPEKKGNQERVSKCEEIIEIAADESRYAGAMEDYVLFRVSNPPEVTVTLDFSGSLPPATPLSLVAFARRLSGDKFDLKWSNICQITTLLATDALRRPKPASSFEHNCTIPGAANGAPLLSYQTGKVIGIQQASYSNSESNFSIEQSPVRNGNFGKKLADTDLGRKSLQLLNRNIPILNEHVSDLEVQNLSISSLPKNIHVGNFSPSVFPSGLPGSLNFTVAELDSPSGFLKFKINQSPWSKVKVIDADGNQFIYSGLLTLKESDLKTFKTPLKIMGFTDAQSSSIGIDIENIQIQ